jgi:transcriptional regulator GlxA family with amidase domain
MAPLQLGVLMVPYQTLDAIGPLDILSSCSKALLSPYEAAKFPGMEGMTAKAIDIEFHHINETLEPLTLTANVRILPSTTCDTCPPLDILLVGGPDPLTFKLSPRFAEFIQKHVGAGKALWTTCTGAYAVAASGVLDGKNATVNHMLLEGARQTFPKVNWVERQWVVDGEVRTAGGACAGMDMVADWVIANYGMEIARFGLQSLDFEPRDVEGALVLPRQHGVEIASG